MKKTVFALFAHPDDESFGPSGTLTLLAEKNDVYLLCATKGEVGENHSGKKGDIVDIREKELLASAKVLGIKKVFFLGYKDGALCNNLYHEVAAKIQKFVDKFHPSLFITVEPRGISGHIDHIFMSMVSSFVFRQNEGIKELWYYCIDRLQSNGTRKYYIYFPPGYKKGEIDKVVDVSSVWDKKVAAIKTHVSQSKDGKRILLQQDALYVVRGFKREEYFLTLNK